ncbi:hypothetical protein KDA14_01800, partial [Candidatus Saccharibacteria bacterium]|nr:hypothetical protein [Candidatus Saccharibacteria bacterium]
IIITVVATGFDASYFANRQRVSSTAPVDVPSPADAEDTAPMPKSDEVSEANKKDMESMDMEIKENSDADETADFTSEKPMPNIWSLNHDDDKDGEHETPAPVVSHDDEDELEKPSFLRRLTKRRSKNDESEDDEK